MWHARPGHLNLTFIKRLKQRCLISDLSNTEWDKCQLCIDVELSKNPSDRLVERQTNILELIYSD